MILWEFFLPTKVLKLFSSVLNPLELHQEGPVRRVILDIKGDFIIAIFSVRARFLGDQILMSFFISLIFCK